jgi:serine/threonine protein kinase/tetratricopeptide (TPR) repeat protein
MPAPKDMDATVTAVGATAIDSEVRRPAARPADSLRARLDPSRGPTALGRYVLLREIGRGAIGVVYAAYHEGLDRKLAIKVLNKQRAGRADLEARLRREARALAKLSHPNVVQVYDVGEFAGRVFVAMEFVEGEPLSAWMRGEHELAEILRMFADAGRGLAAAHEAGVIHRDFKPDNVLVGSDGRPRVLDFGLARAVEHELDGVPGGPTGLRESGPIGTSLDQLLASGSLVRSHGTALDIDEDETLDLHAPSPARDEQDQDAIVTQTNIAGAHLQALAQHQAVAERSEATLDGEGRATSPDLERIEDIAETRAHGENEGAPHLADTVLSEAGPGTLEAEEVLTRTGAMMGTPAYMSPEQFLGQRVDQASDQFSFCIALYEALYGHRPFAGKSPADLATATQSGQVVAAPPNSRVPGWLRQILLRGLQPDPEARFESMTALIDTLEIDRDRPRRRRWLVGLAFAGVAAAALAVGMFAPEREPPCPEVEASAAELWTEAQAAELGAAFEASRLPYASAAWSTVEPRLSAWVHGWAEQRVEACEATRVRHEFSPEVLDLRQACLDRQLRSFEALREELRGGDPRVIERAVEATASLPEPGRCGDVDALLSGVEAPPESVASEVEQLRARLAKIDTLARTGGWQQGLALAEQTVEQARGTGYAPLVAEALLTHGQLLADAGEGDEALTVLQDALDEAERSRHDLLVPRVAIELVSLSIYTRPDPVRGRVWARRAMASLGRLDEQGQLRARGIWSLGNLERLDGAYAQAEAHLREAIALLDEHAPDHPDRAIMLNDLGNALVAQGEVEAARETYAQARRESIEAFGPGHPRVGHAHYNLARLEFDQGELEAAREQLERAREIYVAALGPDHRDVGSVELLLAGIAVAEQRFDEAQGHASRANEIYAAELAEDNVDRAEPLLQLGHVAFARGELDEAIEHYRACLAILQAKLPPNHISTVDAHTNLGLVHLVRGEPEAAVPELEQVVEILEAGVGVDPEKLRMSRLYLGDALLARGGPGDASGAASSFEAALEGCESPAELCADLAQRAAEARAASEEHQLGSVAVSLRAQE